MGTVVKQMPPSVFGYEEKMRVIKLHNEGKSVLEIRDALGVGQVKVWKTIRDWRIGIL